MKFDQSIFKYSELIHHSTMKFDQYIYIIATEMEKENHCLDKNPLGFRFQNIQFYTFKLNYKIE